MMKKTEEYDPFDPEKVAVVCPSCRQRRPKRKSLKPVDEATRKCSDCGRVERWEQPNRKAHGDRRYERMMSRQRRKFGDLDTILFQWIAEPEE